MGDIYVKFQFNAYFETILGDSINHIKTVNHLKIGKDEGEGEGL